MRESASARALFPAKYTAYAAVELNSQGATTATVGKATGHVVTQLLSHCATKPACNPWEIISTNADTMQTMMAESNALKRMGAKRTGIRILFSYELTHHLKIVFVVFHLQPTKWITCPVI